MLRTRSSGAPAVWPTPLRRARHEAQNGNRWYDRMASALRIQDRTERQKGLEKLEKDLKALRKETSKQASALVAIQQGEESGKEGAKLIR